MRFSPLVAAAVLVSVGAGARASVTGPSTQGQCGPAGARTLARDPGARLYQARAFVYGCSNRSGRITRLGRAVRCAGSSSSVDHLALAGETVAYGIHRCGVDFGFTRVLVRRLRDGAQLGSFAATENSLGPESTDFVGSLVVRSDGAAAWIGTGRSIISPAADIQVRTGHGRASVLLDSGRQIKTGSLRLKGSRLTWLHGQRKRSATLR